MLGGWKRSECSVWHERERWKRSSVGREEARLWRMGYADRRVGREVMISEERVMGGWEGWKFQ